MASLATAAGGVARKTFRELHGVVLTAGLMEKTVKVRVAGQKWNNFLKKVCLCLLLWHCAGGSNPPSCPVQLLTTTQYFNDPKTYLVHDPNNSLRAGDVVAITPGWRMSKSKRHVVKHIIKPAGVPISERPPIPTEEERWAVDDARKQAKDERKALKKRIGIAEGTLARAEALLRKAKKEVALRSRLMGVNNSDVD